MLELSIREYFYSLKPIFKQSTSAFILFVEIHSVGSADALDELCHSLLLMLVGEHMKVVRHKAVGVEI
jgi:hypothetical protein